MSDSEPEKHSDSDNEQKGESRGKMLQRHKRELKELQKECEKILHACKKGDKNAKKEAEVKVKSMEDALKKKHQQELDQIEKQASHPEPDEAADAPEASQAKKPSRQQRRKEEKAKKEIETEILREQERKAMGPGKDVLEMEALLGKLRGLNLEVYEVKPDGNCLYSAISHQVQKLGIPQQGAQGYAGIRALAADYMRKNASEFQDFFCLNDAEFADYCDRVEKSTEWGGYSECIAISKALKRSIHIHAADMAVQKIGEDFESNGAPINLSFHRHAFGLGEHYNSLIPAAASS
eukprot:TRINITY_DN8364_c0_g1::TRINITY_DN8364_c0_g1_i1::g.29072::m.29072 TRINITY_DN8364_c0_g1::TRINITY_DN8364_c0_g1_i1::g.29072  ORF type:complete len:303 (-),score=53.69,sp/Q8K2H2/OTU6B_MOUSE/31.45/2e-31,OTU/PF02338.14/1.5e+04,OTU/PF02338.14/3.5e-14,Peptidase_C65/PF10275.4/7.5e+02,Peptidase_C65/PF10275.4/0.61,Peptidase_C65/PF10275.4/0.093,FliE/PF02049.13/0.17,FliE/PF02049.13/2.6e+03,Allexi_40kDa/PF05549.6/1.5,APG6/PF04111.7/2.8,Borrelia_P83/PF05262.6/8.2,DUF913/PF06025.7/13 TRINITY_DN8364_c0_g1_i1:13-89